jgi:hypothetical protein
MGPRASSTSANRVALFRATESFADNRLRALSSDEAAIRTAMPNFDAPV